MENEAEVIEGMASDVQGLTEVIQKKRPQADDRLRKKLSDRVIPAHIDGKGYVMAELTSNVPFQTGYHKKSAVFCRVIPASVGRIWRKYKMPVDGDA